MKKSFNWFLILFFTTIGMYAAPPAINVVHFNNTANYTAGSGVSVVINPTGVFDLNNEFKLELSDVGGTFSATSPVLTTLQEFYTPVINGILPAGLAPGVYKLRIKSTLPTLAVETSSFTVITESSIGVPKFVSSL